MTVRAEWRIVLTRAGDLNVGDVVRVTGHDGLFTFDGWFELDLVHHVNEFIQGPMTKIAGRHGDVWLRPLELVERQVEA